MKNGTLLLLLIGMAFPTTAQNIFEVKVNPFLPLSTRDFSFAISSEYPIRKNLGSEFTAIFISIGDIDEKYIHYNLSGKYYFSPKKGFDGFYGGGFVGYLDRTDFSDGTLGVFIGQKWVTRQNIIFEIGTGIGRTFDTSSYGYIPFARIYLGYRFNAVKSNKTKEYVE